MSFNEEKFRKGLIEYSENFMKTLLWLKDLGKEEFEKQLTWKLKEYMRQIHNLAKECAKEKITKPKQPKELRWYGADVAKAFVGSHLRFAPGCFITKDTVYNAYVDYCSKEKGKGTEMTKNIFSKILLRLIPKIQTAKKRINGKPTYCWRDLELTN